MGLLDRLLGLGRNNTVIVPEREETPRVKIDASSEIKVILEILKELGYMDAYSIESKMDAKKIEYDKSILYRLMIDIDEDKITELKKYASNEKFGYGQEKINEIKSTLEKKVDECSEQGKSKIETVEELISIAKDYIREYQDRLYSFNNTIKLIEENSNSEAEIIAMIAYWIEAFKEQEFGFPIDLEKKINDGAIELRNLPEGGYGEEKIKEFIEACKNEIKIGKDKNMSALEISQSIIPTLVSQYKRRYNSDLETLAKRIDTIESSTFINDEEKQKNIAELRIAFNEMYGHNISIDERTKEMTHSLETLQYGGYGKSKIEEFKNSINKIIEDGYKKGKKEKSILAKIELEYNKLIDDYNSRKAILEDELNKIDSSDMTNKEKTAARKRIKDDFKADNGHKIDLNKEVRNMIEDLSHLENGGYDQSVIRNFKVECEQILTKAKNEKTAILDVYRKIQAVYDEYVNKYLGKLKELQAIQSQINNNRSMSQDEREDALEEYNTKFEMMAGRPLNLKEKVEGFVKKLQELPHGGYGESVISNFKKYCQDILSGDKSEKDKYSLIRQKVRLLIMNYQNNFRMFTEWKKIRMKKYKGKDPKTYEMELDKTITEMLSLSPSELENYYTEDDKKKKTQYKEHNTRLAVKYLAKQEAARENNKEIYQTRLEEYIAGKKPYTDEEIENAIDELRQLELFGLEDNSEEEERLLSPTDYIDGTLFRQMAGASSIRRVA